MSTQRSGPYTVGASHFDPEVLFEDSALFDEIHEYLRGANDLRSALRTAFSMPENDPYVYHAHLSVTLSQAQTAVHAGPTHSLHDWYVDTSGQPTARPSRSDCITYIELFDPSKSPANLLRGMKANARRGSIRAGVAEYLVSKRYLDPSITISKRRGKHHNPYMDFWGWSCVSLEYAGPDVNMVHVQMRHPVLPIFMHHFGCVCPSYESLEILKKVAGGETILDIGSGNGYWTMMLRKQGCEVIAVDSMQSAWRTCWIGDTVETDAIRFIKRREGGGKSDVLLMVYPIVGQDFTKGVMDAYKGDRICVAGTQNDNGYTGFQNESFDVWMAREKPDFDKLAQVPLPSFAGKDEALFVYRRKDQ